MNPSILRAGWRATAVRLLPWLLAAAAPIAFGQDADLSLLKSGPDTAAPGVNVTYSASLLNVGVDAASGVSLDEPLPPGSTFVSFSQTSGPAMSCSTPAVGATGSVNCSLASFAAGASITYDLTIKVDASAVPGQVLMSIGQVNWQGFDPHVENDNGVAGTYLVEAAVADLAISKLAPGVVAANSDLKYTITVSNAGPSNAADAAFSDDLTSPLTTFVSLTQVSGPAFSCTTPAVGGNGMVNCTAASFAPGTAVFELTVHVPAGTVSGTVIENSTRVSSKTTDPNDENNFASVLTTIASADLTLSKTAQATAPRGGTVSYTLTLGNSGPDTAFGLTLVDMLPPGTVFVSWTQNSGPALGCNTPAAGATGVVTCSSPNFGVGASAEFRLTVQVPVAGNVTSQATVTAAVADPVPAGAYGAIASATAAVLDAPTVSMNFTPNVVVPGQTATLNFSLGNPAVNSVALTNVALINALPSGLTVPGATSSVCGGTLTTTAPGSIALSGASIAVGGTCQFGVVVTTAVTAAVYNNVSGAVSSSNGGTGGTATASLVAAALPVITHTIAPSTILMGATTTATFTLSNPNGVVLDGVGLADPLPAGLIVAPAPGIVNGCGGTLAAAAGGGAITLTGATLAANASCTISVQLQGTSPGLWSSAATVNATGFGNGNTATALVTVYLPVPTLHDYAVWLLAALLLIVAAFAVRRRG